MADKGRTHLRTAVHLRTWLVRLERGESITIRPSSQDHSFVEHLVTAYVERAMRDRLRRQKPKAVKKKDRSKLSTNKYTVRNRRYQERARERDAALYEKYFSIHGGGPDQVKDRPGKPK